jgi:hypothetical protein
MSLTQRGTVLGEHPLRLVRIDPLLPQESDLRRQRVTVVSRPSEPGQASWLVA